MKINELTNFEWEFYFTWKTKSWTHKLSQNTRKKPSKQFPGHNKFPWIPVQKNASFSLNFLLAKTAKPKIIIHLAFVIISITPNATDENVRNSQMNGRWQAMIHDCNVINPIQSNGNANNWQNGLCLFVHFDFHNSWCIRCYRRYNVYFIFDVLIINVPFNYGFLNVMPF